MGIQEVGGARVLLLDVYGPAIGTEDDAVELIGSLWGQEASTIAIPTDRLVPGFLHLSTGIAGAFIQKLVNYRVRLVLIGDVSAAVARSGALQAFVAESNRGNEVWFVDDEAALEQRLAD